MRLNVTVAAAVLLALSSTASHAVRLTQDPLTKLPLPESTMLPMVPNNTPVEMGAAQVCRSSFQGNYYSLYGKVDTAVAWYQSHLTGFSHLQSADHLTHVSATRLARW